MSENWNKNQLNNRLDSVFSDLGDPTHLPGMSIFNQISGWIWEIDTQGRIVNSSAEVEALLGYDPADLLEQPLSKISNFDLENAELPTDSATSVPKMMELVFYQVDGKKETAKCHLMPLHANNQLSGWRGVTVLNQSTGKTEEQSTHLAETIPDSDLIEQDFPAAFDNLISPDPHLPSSNGDLLPESVQADSEELSYEEQYIAAAHQPSEVVADFMRRIDSDPDREWLPDEIQLVEQVHDQLELALENANLFQQTQSALAETDEQARRLRLLNELSEKLSQADSLQEMYSQTAQAALEIFSGYSASILIQVDNFLEVRSATGANADQITSERIPVQEAPYFTALQQNRLMIYPEIENPALPDSKSMIAGAILSENRVTGAINVSSNQSNAFGQQDENFMAQLTSIVNGALENQQLLNRIQSALASTEEQARRLAVLNQLSEGLGRSGSLEEIIALTNQRMNDIIPCQVCSTAIYNPELESFLVYENSQDGTTAEPRLVASQNSMIAQIAQQAGLRSEFDLIESEYTDLQAWIEDYQVSSLIGAPLLSGEKAIGVVMVGNRKGFPYSLQDEALLLSISSILASTLDNRQLFQQIQRRSVQLETSAEVSRIASTILDPSELLPEVADLILTGFGLYYAGIFLIDEDGAETGEAGKWAVLRAGTGEPGKKMMAAKHKLEIGGESMIGTAISSSQAQIALDVGAETIHFRNPDLPHTRSEMALPLTSRGLVLGAISIQSDREAAFSQEDITSLQTMADHLANAIENARLFEQTEERAKELTVLNEMARAYTQTMDVEHLIEDTFTYTNHLLNAENFYLALYNDKDNVINFKLFAEDGKRIPPPEPKINVGNGLTDWIILNKIPVLIPRNVEKEMMNMGIEPRGRTASAYLGVPMMIGNQVIGVIAIQSYQEDEAYTTRDMDLLSAVASQAAVAIDNALRFQQTQTRAQYEAVMREITARVHSSTNPESILKTAVREVSHALGRQAFIELNPDEKRINTGELRNMVEEHTPTDPPPSEDEE